ncbi:MAG TPA: DUF5916 domain-containing protein [Terriglobia bacterium]|nr:DUF5916 domain-containing protein [Terriglobia bacterium]
MKQRNRIFSSLQPSRASSCRKNIQAAAARAVSGRVMWRSVALGLASLLAVGISFAQSSSPAEVSGARPTVTIPRVSVAPKLSDFLGMKPDAAMAGKLLHIHGFIQRTPRDDVAPNQRTDVYLGYDSNYLYAVFVAFDEEPGKVRAHMTVRDHLTGDERLDLFLDTFHDHRHAYVFTVNPFGLQQDGTYDENASTNYDSSFDTVWKSNGRRTSRGFVVWEAIPFKSLRFPATQKQTWGVLFIRWIPRNNGSDTWPRVSTRIQGRLGQEATLEGINSISRGHNVQFIPYAYGRSYRALDTRDPSNPQFTSRSFDPRTGLDGKAVLKDSLVLDATVNPDFSQVESDQPQVTVNQRFAVNFPEKRPFFLENANFFQTPLNLFFSRDIADPQFGVRLTGKVGHYAIGTLLADDQSPGEIVPPESPLAGARAHFSVVRINRDVGKQSTVGMIYTDREFSGSYNRVGGIDGHFKFNPNLTLDWQGVASSTTLPGGLHSSGPAYKLQLQQIGYKFYYNLNYEDLSPGFNTQTGFLGEDTVENFVPYSRSIPRPAVRPDFRSLGQFITYRFRPASKTLISWGPALYFDPVWDHAGNELDQYYDTGLSFELTGQTYFEVYQAADHELLRPRDFSVLPANRVFVHQHKGIYLGSQYYQPFTFTAQYEWGTDVNFVPPPGRAPMLANLTHGQVTMTIRPLTKLEVDNTYILERLTSRQGGASIFNNHILRSKWNWQFSPRLGVRTIFQYNTILPNQRLTSLQPTKQFNADFLVSYIVNPWTALYVGYNHDLQNLDLIPLSTGSELIRTNQFLNDGRQFFVKFSYFFGF